MAACSCGGIGEPRFEGHWLGCASWGAPSFKARLTEAQLAQRAAIIRGQTERELAQLEARCAWLREKLS